MMRSMRLGLHALGIGAGADAPVIQAVASAAEQSGFATLWAGEHVVMVDDAASEYPYADDGKIAVPADADWIDPMIGLSFAAAATATIRIATGVLLLPEHNPVIVAKQAASLDKLSGGRFSLGIGIGWSREEFDAIGVPFERRAARAADYVAAMRAIWRDEIASYAGEFANFSHIRVNPRPREGTIPILCGGNSDAALRRVARWADGWYGFNLRDVDEVAAAVTTLRRHCEQEGRDVAALHLAVALRAPMPSDAERLAQLGVDELVLVASPPPDPASAAKWVADVAAAWR